MYLHFPRSLVTPSLATPADPRPDGGSTLSDQAVLERVITAIDDHFVILDRDWHYVYTNQRMLDVAQMSRSDVIGRVVWETFPALVGTDFETAARRALADQRPARCVFHYPPRDRWFEAQFYPTPEGVSVLTSDITDQHRAESSLAKRVGELGALYEFTDALQHATSLAQVYQAAFDSMRAALDASRAAILLLDERGAMRFADWRGLSDEYRAAVDGHSPWRDGGRDVAPIWIADAAQSDLEPWLKHCLEQEQIRALGFIPLVAAGVLIGKIMVYYHAPHPAEAQEIDLAVTIGRQLAFAVERQRAEDDRRRAADELREANRRKDEFLSTLAHELRNPLSPIVNMLNVMQHAPGDDALHERGTTIIRRQVRHLVRLVDDLLDIARINHDRLELRREPVLLRAVLQQAIETCRPLVDAQQHTLNVDLPGAPVYLYADPVRLGQVFGNLLNNASKYTPPHGVITITATVEGDEVLVAVRDNGIGIPPDKLSHVFDLFTQLDQSLARAQGGLGIGLALVRRLVEMHDGTVTAASAGAGLGSEFVVRLPVFTAVPTGVFPSSPARDDRARRVLIADGDGDSAEALAASLHLAGHATAVAVDAATALKIGDGFRPDVVLLDLALPGSDAESVCRAIRASAWGRDIAVVGLIGWAQDGDQRGASGEFAAFLSKPLDARQVAAVLASTPGRPNAAQVAI